MSSNTTIRVRPGCTVRLKKQSDGTVVEYKITRAVRNHTELGRGSMSYAPEEHTLSNESPLGNALIGHKIGEVVRGYEIIDISRTEDAIENLSDSTEETLLENRDELLELERKLKDGEKLDAIILSCNNYSHPRKGKVVVSEEFYKTETGDSILSGVSATNIEMKDTGYYEVQLELFDSKTDGNCSIDATIIIDKTAFEEMGIHCGAKTTGLYSYNSNDAIKLHSAFVRIDSDTGEFVYENNPSGVSYYFRMEEKD